MINKLIKKIKKTPKSIIASIAFLICSFLQKGISTLTTPIFTRLLTTDEYGMYSIFNSWTNIFTIFVTLKISSGVLQQALVKYNDDKNNLLTSLHSLSSLLVILWLFIYMIYPELLKKITGMEKDIIIAMLIVIWATNIFEIWAQGERNEYNYKKLVIVTLLTTLLKPIVGIIAILMFPKFKVKARIYSLVIVELCSYIWLLFFQFHKTKKENKKFKITKYWKYAITFCIPLIPHYLSQQVLSQTDRLMINHYVGFRETGIYSLAYQIAMVFTLFITAMTNTLNPWIYKSIKNKNYSKISPIVSFLLTGLMALNLLLILFAPEILKLFAPSTYYDAIWTIPAVTLSCIFMFLYGVFVCFEFYYEKKKYIVYASITGAILNVILNIIFIPKFGYIAAAYTTLLCYIIFCIMHYIFMQKIIKEQNIKQKIFDTKKLILECTIFVLIGLSIMLFYDNLIIRLIFCAVIFIVLCINKNTIINTVKLLLKKE